MTALKRNSTFTFISGLENRLESMEMLLDISSELRVNQHVVKVFETDGIWNAFQHHGYQSGISGWSIGQSEGQGREVVVSVGGREGRFRRALVIQGNGEQGHAVVERREDC